jgi:hypothetical protein
MGTNKQALWASVLIGVVTLSALGCATSGPSKAIAPAELASLAGKWIGTVTLPSGRNVPGTFELLPTGDYSTEASGFSARGKAQVKDGNLALVSTSTSGGMATGQRTSLASLYERPDGMLVLRGTGNSDVGPFSFEVSRKK